MNPQATWEQERAEQEAADRVEERRVAGEDAKWQRACEAASAAGVSVSTLPPWLFADERSQRKAEDEARFAGPIDDYAAWQDEPVGAEERFR